MAKLIRFSRLIDTHQQTPVRPAATAFANGLICAFKANDGTNNLYSITSADGINWSKQTQVGTNQTPAPPAIGVFNKVIYCAFKANNSTNDLYITSSTDGIRWSDISQVGQYQSAYAPALCAWRGGLYCAFVANDGTNDILLTSSPDGNKWSVLSRIGNNQSPDGVSLCVFNNALYCAFRANDVTNNLYITNTTDGVNWSTIALIGNNQSPASPSLCTIGINLCCAFMSNDGTNKLYITSSADGLRWSPITQMGNNTTSAGPALATFSDKEIACLFKANDSTNELYQVNSREADWMQQNINTLGSRTLGNICIPGSHDSGMTGCVNPTIGARLCNVQTQTRGVLGQLQNGARYFDIRPTISSGKYYTGHYTNTDTILDWQGANGELIDRIIYDINLFTQHHQELIVLKISQDLQTDQNYRRFNQQEWNALLQKLSGISNLYVNTTVTDLTKISIQDYIGTNANVVVIVDPGDASITLGSYAYKGFFPMSTFPLFDSYSNMNNAGSMIADQISKMKQHSSSSYFLLSWTLTQNNDQAVDCALSCTLPEGIWWIVDLFADTDTTSVLELAEAANTQLYDNPSLMASVSSTCFPNIIYVDNVNPAIGLVEMAMKMNAL